MKLNKNFYLIRVVDDDEEFLDAVEFILSTDDWKSQSFQSSEDFLRQEASNINAPGCLILDFFMPIKNGLEVQAELKKINPDLPIIFLTGHGDTFTSSSFPTYHIERCLIGSSCWGVPFCSLPYCALNTQSAEAVAAVFFFLFVSTESTTSGPLSQL